MEGEESYPLPERQIQDQATNWIASHGELTMVQEELVNPTGYLDTLGICNKLIAFMKIGHSDVRDAVMVCIGQLLRKGYSPYFVKTPDGVSTLIKYFNILSRQLKALDRTGGQPLEAAKIERRLLGVLCVLAQLINDNPKWSLPLTRRFVLNLFMLSPELVADCSRRMAILKVYSVLLLTLSQNRKFLQENSLTQNLRVVLSKSIPLAEATSTKSRLDAALQNTHKMKTVASQDFRLNRTEHPLQWVRVPHFEEYSDNPTDGQMENTV